MATVSKGSIDVGQRRARPWHKYFDGRLWTFTRGKDFQNLLAWRANLLVAAKRRGIRVVTRKLDADHLQAQAVGRRPGRPRKTHGRK